MTLRESDGYNRWFDEILADFIEKERCVDDTCHFDSSLEEHWWRTIDWLITLVKASVVLKF